MPRTGRLSGTVLQGRFRLVEMLGRGAVASVYRAHDEMLDREVAVKIFYADAPDGPDTARQLFEVKMLARFNHHGLVTMLDAGVVTETEQPHVFLVMELIHGADLGQLIASGPLSLAEVSNIGYDIAEALEYIHSRGVVHRDVKPANILLVRYGDDDTRPRAKLTDFGIARIIGGEDSGEGPGLSAGTAAYLSPEQVDGGSATPQSDIYALGLVLLECLTGELAFPGDPVQSVVARFTQEPEIPEHVSPQWRELILRMTAKDPADRPAIRDVILELRTLAYETLEPGEQRRVEPAPSAPPADVIPADEAARLEAVRRYQILDTPPDGTFDRITALTARLLRTPIAIVSIVDHDRVWFKSHHGIDVQQVGRDPGLCASAILYDKPWVVESAVEDPRTLTNPLVAGSFGLQFYAGVPLRTKDGYNLGTLCVLDFEPRVISEDELATLQDLASLVVADLELRLEARLAAED